MPAVLKWRCPRVDCLQPGKWPASLGIRVPTVRRQIPGSGTEWSFRGKRVKMPYVCQQKDRVVDHYQRGMPTGGLIASVRGREPR